METVKQAALGICFAAVLTGVLYTLSPDGVMNRKMKYITGILMLFCIVSPFLKINISAMPSVPDHTVTYNAGEMLASQAEYIIGEALKAENITFSSLKVTTDISPSGDISIISVSVAGASEPDKAKEIINGIVAVGEVVIIDG